MKIEHSITHLELFQHTPTFSNQKHEISLVHILFERHTFHCSYSNYTTICQLDKTILQFCTANVHVFKIGLYEVVFLHKMHTWHKLNK